MSDHYPILASYSAQEHEILSHQINQNLKFLNLLNDNIKLFKEEMGKIDLSSL